MTSIRPPFPTAPQPATDPARPARTAAQRAFFEAALGKAAASQAAPAPAASAPPPAPVETRAAAAPSEAPRKILRPGSLLDIRV